MSKIKVLAVKDHKVGIFMKPVFDLHLGSAIRSFEDACSVEGNFARHPNDYSLFELGEFDQLTGIFTQLDVPNLLISARQCVDSKSNVQPELKM